MVQTVPKRLSWDTHFHHGKQIEGNRTVMPNGYPDHDHDFVEITVLIAGHAMHRTIHGEHTIGVGDALLLRPGAWHGFHRSAGLRGYNCCFDAGILGRELAWMADDALLGRLLWSEPLSPQRQGVVELYLPAADLAVCRAALESLTALPVTHYERHRAEHVALLIQILGILARNLPPTRSAKRRQETHPAVATILALIENDPAQAWTLSGLAMRARVTPAHLVRLFRSATGLPPIAYLIRRRLERAAGLLARSDDDIGRIGTLVGWPDANYFARRFRSQFGMTPTVYRQRFQKT